MLGPAQREHTHRTGRAFAQCFPYAGALLSFSPPAARSGRSAFPSPPLPIFFTFSVLLCVSLCTWSPWRLRAPSGSVGSGLGLLSAATFFLVPPFFLLLLLFLLPSLRSFSCPWSRLLAGCLCSGLGVLRMCRLGWAGFSRLRQPCRAWFPCRCSRYAARVGTKGRTQQEPEKRRQRRRKPENRPLPVFGVFSLRLLSPGLSFVCPLLPWLRAAKRNKPKRQQTEEQEGGGTKGKRREGAGEKGPEQGTNTPRTVARAKRSLSAGVFLFPSSFLPFLAPSLCFRGFADISSLSFFRLALPCSPFALASGRWRAPCVFAVVVLAWDRFPFFFFVFLVLLVPLDPM